MWILLITWKTSFLDQLQLNFSSLTYVVHQIGNSIICPFPRGMLDAQQMQVLISRNGCSSCQCPPWAQSWERAQLGCPQEGFALGIPDGSCSRGGVFRAQLPKQLCCQGSRARVLCCLQAQWGCLRLFPTLFSLLLLKHDPANDSPEGPGAVQREISGCILQARPCHCPGVLQWRTG